MAYVFDTDTHDRHKVPDLAAIARSRDVVDSPAPARRIYDGRDVLEESDMADWGADDVFGGRSRHGGREARLAAAGARTAAEDRRALAAGSGRFARGPERQVDDWLAPVRDARPVTVGRARPAENWLAGTDEYDVGESLQLDELAEPVEDLPIDRAESAADRRAAALDELWSAGEVAEPQPPIRLRTPGILRAASPRQEATAAAPPVSADPPLTHEYRDISGRRTVVVRGRPETESVSPATEMVKRSARALGHTSGASRPERLAAWAVGLGFLLILVAIATASA